MRYSPVGIGETMTVFGTPAEMFGCKYCLFQTLWFISKEVMPKEGLHFVGVPTIHVYLKNPQ